MVTSKNNYLYVLKYLTKTETIRVEEGLGIALQFTAFDVESQYNCHFNHLVIEDGDVATYKLCGKTLAGTSSAGTTFVSKSNIVKLHFTTMSTKSGWSVIWTARKPGDLRNHYP